jgi:uncharacterized protein
MMDNYFPPPVLRGGHRMTIVAWARPRWFPQLPPAVPRYFEVAPDARVLAHCNWQEAPRQAPTLLALHGLEGSSDAHYMRGLADKAFRAGFNVVRLNQRNCGGTNGLSRGLYHSGLTEDPAHVIREMRETDGLPWIGVAGYSLGGNLTFKLAGEYGDQAPIGAVAAVSPTLDLAQCVEALERPANRLYEWNFVWGLKRRMREKAQLFPSLYSTAPLRHIRSVRAFDEAYTAPHHGFRDAADYYYRASSMRVVERIRVPALVLTAEDDPFVPSASFRDPTVIGNPHITTRITRFGGHCGFIAPRMNGDDGYWAERTVVEFLRTHWQNGRSPH